MSLAQWLDDGRRDLRHAVRLLFRHPIAAITAMLSLAIGIGANTAMFTVANALFFQPPGGVAQPDRLVDIGATFKTVGFSATSYPIYLDVRERATTLAGVYAHPRFPHPMSLEVETNGAERIFTQYVTTNYFTVLGVSPAAGRLFNRQDSDQPGASPLLVLSYRFWQRRFDADPSIVGRAVRVNQKLLTIVGVAPDGFQGTGLTTADAWMPLEMIATGDVRESPLTARQGAWLLVGGRLNPATSVEQASAEVSAIGRALDTEYPDSAGAHGLALVRASKLPGNRPVVAAFIALLMATCAIILVVACSNVAGMHLARAAARWKETAVRLAIGAGRSRLARQMLTETIVVFVPGGLAGLWLARLLVLTLIPLLPPLPVPISVALPLDGRVLMFATLLSLGAAILSGLAPALQSARRDVTTALHNDDPGSSPRSRLRDAFVVVQVSMSVVLVITGGLFARALEQAGTVYPGFDPHGVETASLDLGMAGYTDTTGPLFWRDALDRIRQLPSVDSATAARVLPGGFEGIGLGSVRVPGVTPPNGQPAFTAEWNIVEPGYFATVRLPLIAGRDFNAFDVAGAPRAAIVGERFARQVWPGQDAVGKAFAKDQFTPGKGVTGRDTFVVVGVARDIKTSSLVDGLAGSFIYLPLQQNYTTAMTATMTIAARTKDGRRIAEEIRRVVAALNPSLPIVNSQTLEDASKLGLTPQRVAAMVAGSLGLVGALLAGIGIYGLMAYSVSRRTREFGIRIALGAGRGSVMRMVVRQTATLAGVGLATGVMTAAALSRVLAGLLFGIRPLDPLVFGGTALLFGAIALAACIGPAGRATSADPLAALRHE